MRGLLHPAQPAGGLPLPLSAGLQRCFPLRASPPPLAPRLSSLMPSSLGWGISVSAWSCQVCKHTSQIADRAAFDDRALINFYDQAVHSFKEILGNGRSSSECRSSNEAESSIEEGDEKEEGRQWQIGDPCLAVWSGDGLLYPACITSMDRNCGSCVVRFDGYGNEDEQPLDALLPPGWRTTEDEDASREWGIGDACQAVWSGDGLLYPATVQEVDADASTCQVEFEHYGNWEQKLLADLMPPEGCTEESSSTLQFQEKRNSKGKGKANSSISQLPKDEKPPLVPPVHGHDDSDSLISMLLAWHLSGYHTGYYMGLRQGQQEVAIPARKRRPAQQPRVSEHR